MTLFHTGENLRHDHIKTDYSISHDLNIQSDKHLRLPYWMEMIDWSHEGLMGNINPRYGQLLNLERLQSPLGNQFLTREQKCILLSSHLREPRASALSALQKLMPVDGFGPYFDKKIKDHHSSNFLKKDILARYAYNLCPENGLYPGYVTEKIPEAFTAGCLPITYVDRAVNVDFNPRAFINLAPMAESGYDGLAEILQSKSRLEAHAEEPLITQRPSIEQLRSFLQKIISNSF
nr:glycosyltransferase family 10 [Polynucleobacter sp. CS-Odin-A6]